MTERPDLTAVATKPDIIDRLRDIGNYTGDIYARDMCADAIEIILGLRDTCDRRLAMIRDLQRDLADLRQEEGR